MNNLENDDVFQVGHFGVSLQLQLFENLHDFRLLIADVSSAHISVAKVMVLAIKAVDIHYIKIHTSTSTYTFIYRKQVHSS